MRGNHTLMFLSIALPSPLSKNKINKILKKRERICVPPMLGACRKTLSILYKNWLMDARCLGKSWQHGAVVN